jgi:hypothetical protein
MSHESLNSGKTIKKVIIVLICFIFKFLKVKERYLGITHLWISIGQYWFYRFYASGAAVQVSLSI